MDRRQQLVISQMFGNSGIRIGKLILSRIQDGRDLYENIGIVDNKEGMCLVMKSDEKSTF